MAAIAALAAAATGCGALRAGQNRGLTFSYPHNAIPASLQEPIALGAKLDLDVAQTATAKPVTLRTVTSENPGVVTVVNYHGDALTLQAKSVGSTILHFSVTMPGGSVVNDTEQVRVAVPTAVNMHHACTSDATGLYLVNQDILIPYAMQLSGGRDVVGYGYAPFKATPARGLKFDTSSDDIANLHFKTAPQPETVTIASTIGHATLTVQLVKPGDIDGAMLDSKDVKINDQAQAVGYVLPTANGKPVCQAHTPIVVKSETPQICDAASVGKSLPVEQFHNEWGWIEITGKTAGTCKFRVTFSAGNNGAGASATFTAQVTQQTIVGALKPAK